MKPDESSFIPTLSTPSLQSGYRELCGGDPAQLVAAGSEGMQIAANVWAKVWAGGGGLGGSPVNQGL